MTTFTAAAVVADVQRILNDPGAAKFSLATINANILLAIRRVKMDAPASCYSSTVAFDENAVITGGTTVAMDVRWQDAVTHYTAHLCLMQTDRNTVNAEFAARELKAYGETL